MSDLGQLDVSDLIMSLLQLLMLVLWVLLPLLFLPQGLYVGTWNSEEVSPCDYFHRCTWTCTGVQELTKYNYYNLNKVPLSTVIPELHRKPLEPNCQGLCCVSCFISKCQCQVLSHPDSIIFTMRVLIIQTPPQWFTPVSHCGPCLCLYTVSPHLPLSMSDSLLILLALLLLSLLQVCLYRYMLCFCFLFLVFDLIS